MEETSGGASSVRWQVERAYTKLQSRACKWELVESVPNTMGGGPTSDETCIPQFAIKGKLVKGHGVL